MDTVADLALTNGRIYTVDSRDSTAQAMAIAGDRIVAVGSASEVEPALGPSTRMVDLEGRGVIPGLNDAHLHLLSFGQSLENVDLRDVSTIAEAVDLVRVKAAGTAAGRWIAGSGWDRNVFGRLPTREDLDAAAPHNPVFLASKDLHSLWVNSLALEKAGITPSTPDPEDGEIVRDLATGAPTGLLREGGRAALFRAVPAPSPEEVRAALSRAIRVAVARGLTSLQTFESRETFVAAQELAADGALGVRLCCHLWKDGLAGALDLGVRTGFGNHRLRLGHLKLFLDGALGSRTALMLAPYSGGQSRGIQTTSREELRETILSAAHAGIAVAVHAIGDAANRIAIDVLEETAGVWKPRGLRQRIEHVQLLADGDARRLGRLGVIASMQPVHATSDWRVAGRHWGDRARLGYAWRSVLRAGAPLAFGSDCPVESMDPLRGLYAAVTRKDERGEPPGGWYPDECLSPADALRAYTLGSAYASGEEHSKGSLEPGKLADFVVLSRDPFAEAPEALLETTVEATVVGGKVVYGEF